MRSFSNKTFNHGPGTLGVQKNFQRQGSEELSGAGLRRIFRGRVQKNCQEQGSEEFSQAGFRRNFRSRAQKNEGFSGTGFIRTFKGRVQKNFFRVSVQGINLGIQQ